MRQVQGFKKTLLSVAVVTALGGYGSYSQAQFELDRDSFLTSEQLNFDKLIEAAKAVPGGDSLKESAEFTLAVLDQYSSKYETKEGDKDKKKINISILGQLAAQDFIRLTYPEIIPPVAGDAQVSDGTDEALSKDSSDDDQKKEEKPLEKRAKSVLTKVEGVMPDLHNGVGRAAVTLQNKVNESIGRRLSSGRTGISAGDMFESQGFWAEYIFSDGKMDNKGDVKGYEAKVNGVTLGVDSMLNDQMTVGFAFTFGDTKVETNDVKRETTTDTYMGTLYTGWMQDNYFLDAMFSYGRGTNEYKRSSVADKTISYKGEADSTIWGASFVAGYNYQMNQWILQPQVAFNYASVDFDDLAEKKVSGGEGLAQKRKMKEFEVMELGAGLKLLGDFEVGRGALQPEFVLMGYHDFKDDKPEVTVSFLNGVGTPFTLTGKDRKQNRFLAGLGVSYKMENNLSLGLHYDHNWMGDYKADGFNATVRYDF
ncbi:autotransporter outer membrane beta-barrel domain-containing protein [Endozoicomonas numazuensis]|uniref:autotransporter outer membrane beta-barrel domain-containing protein n=1 Tax=Endozoicomonas numazuensis TaxID=1137799 RepID=UPI000691B427|nr:autotransporter outer membrane beta-barrel domain-containing protein [Endozoicomonas numazuensis]